MKVSVIIPVYNSEKYLRDCLDSVYAQTIGDFEVVIVNDGSTDSSLSVANQYAAEHPANTQVISVENGGQGRAKNIGMEHARGEFILNIDSDDYIAPDMLQKMVEAAELHQAEIVICDFYRVTGEACIPESSRLTSGVFSAVGQCWNKLFRRSLIGDVRYPCGLWYEDTEFSGKLMLRSKKIFFLEEPLYYYRIGHVSTMRNKNVRKNLDILSVLDHIRSFAEENSISFDFDYFVLTHVVLEAVKRVSGQSGPDVPEVLSQLRAYAHKYIPDLSASAAFRAESRNRRMVMFLNYHGLHALSNRLLALKR